MVFRWLFRKLLLFRILHTFKLWGVYLALILWARQGLFRGLGAGLLMSALTLLYSFATYWFVSWVHSEADGFIAIEVLSWVLWLPILWFAALDTELYIVCLRAPNQILLGNLLSTQRYEEKFAIRMEWIKEQMK